MKPMLKRNLTPAIFGLVAFLLGVLGSASTSFWGDEGPTVSAIRRTWPELLKLVGNIDAVHATYYAIAKLWTSLTGINEVSLRSLSAVAFALATVLVFHLGVRLRDRNFGAVAAAVFILIPRNLYNADYARSFALDTMVAVGLTLLFIKATEIQLAQGSLGLKKYSGWVAYALLLAAGAYLFEYLLLVGAAHFVTALLSRHRSKITVPIAVSGIFAVAASAVVLLASYGQRFQISANGEAALSQRQIILVQWFLTPLGGVVAWLFILVGVAQLAAVAAIEKRTRELTGRPVKKTFGISNIAFPWMLVPILLLLAANSVVPLYAIRYLSISTPAVALVMAATFLGIRYRWLVAAGLVVLALAATPRYIQDRTQNSDVGTPDWRSVAQTVERLSKPGDAVLVSPLPNGITAPRLAVRVYPESFRKVADPLLVTSASVAGRLNDDVLPVEWSGTRLAKFSRVWVVVEKSRPQWAVPELLDLGFHEFYSVKIPNGRVMGFSK